LKPMTVVGCDVSTGLIGTVHVGSGPGNRTMLDASGTGIVVPPSDASLALGTRESPGPASVIPEASKHVPFALQSLAFCELPHATKMTATATAAVHGDRRLYMGNLRRSIIKGRQLARRAKSRHPCRHQRLRPCRPTDLPLPSNTLRDRIRRRLADEIGRIPGHAPYTVALCYPSPYRVGMSSLGFQRIYRALMEEPGLGCERAFLDDECEDDAARRPEHPVTYESMHPIEALPVIAFSVAYELEIAGVVRMLQAAGIPPRRADRDEQHPLVIAGGPLTFSNPMPLAAIVDAIIVGEAETRAVAAVRAAEQGQSRAEQLALLASIPHVFVPSHHAVLPPVGAEDDALLPAFSAIRTAHTELSGMFLVETERGCSRGCSYCVMRRTTNGGMRIVPANVVLDVIPRDARRVGLVGAAVSDHPDIVSIVNALADRGCEVGLSSLRPDRLATHEDFVAALARAGYRTLTTAMDGTSERVRDLLDRRARPRHLLRCAELAKKYGMDRLKLYLMVGTPGETEDDVDECVAFVRELSRIVPVALGIAPFCPKRNTPLADAPFAGIDTIDDRLDRLRRGLKGRAEIRATSARWAWVEYVLAQGGEAQGHAVIDAVGEGGSFRAYERAMRSVATRGGASATRLPLLHCRPL
jgi:radical SAM superfamily enzyme YgiQ (UPF0313 family)